MKSANVAPGIIFMLILLAGCQGYAGRPADTANPIKADPQLVEKVRGKGWLGDGISTCKNLLMKNNEFKECVLVDAALLASYDPDNPNHFGKDYDPEKYYNCRVKKSRSRGDIGCNKYKLTRNEPKPVWPYADVPSLRWPESPEKSVYYPGIGREEYFKALCKAEAGQIIYKTVDDVEGVYQIRPQYPERSLYMKDPYVLEDPYGFDLSESSRAVFPLLSLGVYEFVETSLYDPWLRHHKSHVKKYFHESFLEEINKTSNFFRYSGVPYSKTKVVKRQQVNSLKSKYGYVWRGIDRPFDRESGIAGGELLVVDLTNNEVLAVKRGFAFTAMKADGQTWWLGSVRCHGNSKADFKDFIVQVLHPAKKSPLP